MHRRNFLTRCGLAAAGAVCASALSPSTGLLQAARTPVLTTPTPSVADPKLLRYLSTYSTKVYLWDADTFAQTTGLDADGDAVNLLVRVDDIGQLAQFFGSQPFKRLGTVYSTGNTLSFNFQGTAYTVTNELTADFKQVMKSVK